MSLSEQAKNKQRAGDALGVRVDVAIVAYRYTSPKFITMMVILTTAAASAIFDPTWKTWLAVAAPSFLGLMLLYNLTRPTVILTRIEDRIVVLRPPLLRSTSATGHVIAEYDTRTPTALGPASWGYRPLMVSYHRYWVSDDDGKATEQLVSVATSDAAP